MADVNASGGDLKQEGAHMTGSMRRQLLHLIALTCTEADMSPSPCLLMSDLLSGAPYDESMQDPSMSGMSGSDDPMSLSLGMDGQPDAAMGMNMAPPGDGRGQMIAPTNAYGQQQQPPQIGGPEELLTQTMVLPQWVSQSTLVELVAFICQLAHCSLTSSSYCCSSIRDRCRCRCRCLAHARS